MVSNLDGQLIHRLATREVAKQLGLQHQQAVPPSGLTVEDLVRRDRIGGAAADRVGKRLQLHQQGVGAVVLDHFRLWLGVPAVPVSVEVVTTHAEATNAPTTPAIATTRQ